VGALSLLARPRRVKRESGEAGTSPVKYAKFLEKCKKNNKTYYNSKQIVEV